MKVLVTGAAGMLARAVVTEFAERGHDVVACAHAELDVQRNADVQRVMRDVRPHAVVQCAAYTRVDDAEHDEAQAVALNGEATSHVAAACNSVGARLVYPSSDYVFDGRATAPYSPDAPTAPLSAYGRSKLAGEHAARITDALVVRTSWLYGRGGRNFVRTVMERARNGQSLRVVRDQHGAPTWTTDLARMVASLLEHDAPAGTYHATNSGHTTWYDFARAALDAAGIAADVTATTAAEYAQVARRPAYSVLDCTATYAITGAAPHWRDALRTAVAEGL